MERMDNPVGDVRRISRIADMLELASAARRKMAAWRSRMVRTSNDATISLKVIPRRGQRGMTTVSGHALPPRRDTDDAVRVVHNVDGSR
jgi:hypothetical protein